MPILELIRYLRDIADASDDATKVDVRIRNKKGLWTFDIDIDTTDLTSEDITVELDGP